jgi:oxygen-independent coproporphyrinogen-3 oxidase
MQVPEIARRVPTAPASGEGELRALYVHIPFCHSICPFCAFAVHGNRPRLHAPFVESLLREISLAHPSAGQPRRPGTIESLYIGGGTPSTLSAAHLERILAALTIRFPPATDVEIALEVNPEDGERGYLRALRNLGVNRISLGVQSLEDATLRALGRGHSARQAEQAYEAAVASGFDNINVDLMFGAPRIEPEAFRRDVARVAAWRPAHVSLYGLDIEERTLFGRNAAIRAWSASERDRQAEQYLYAAGVLAAAGYEHYEVSNFALPGRLGRQNLLVWSGAAYLGFGPGAHSWIGGRRRANERHLAAYGRRIAHGEAPIAFEERVDARQAANEQLMLALRQRSGLDAAAWCARHGVSWDRQRTTICVELAQDGLAAWDGSRLALTPRGMLLADEITERLMLAE